MNMNEPPHGVAAYAARRSRLLQSMGAGVAVIPTAPERIRNRDSHYPYRFDSYFYYLTGFPEPEAVLVLVAGEKPRSILFCREKHEERETWDGFRYGPQVARERFGFDDAQPIGQLDETLATLLGDQPALFYAPGAEIEWDARVMRWLNAVRAQARTGISAPAQIHDIRVLLDQMRLSGRRRDRHAPRRHHLRGAHRRAIRRAAGSANTRSGRIAAEFRRHGAQFPAWPIIERRECLRAALPRQRRHARTAICCSSMPDATDGYAADITFPVNGRYRAQRRTNWYCRGPRRFSRCAGSCGMRRTTAVRCSRKACRLNLLTGSLDHA